MIETLRLEHIAIVERAELEFGPGLNVLTGETGTGKSIVLGALGLLAGQRASADALREGEAQGAVEAVFRTESLPDVERELVARGFAVDDHQLVVRRTLARSGRSRAQLCGQLVPVSVLAELFASRIEISSQHGTQSLLRPDGQGWLLDATGDLLERRAAVSNGVASLRALDREIASLRAEAEERERRRESLAFALREIDDVRPAPDERERLGLERTRLAHAERLREEGSVAMDLLSGDPLRSDDRSAADLLAAASRRVAALTDLDPGLGEIATRLELAGAELRDVAAALERYVEGVEADPARLEQVEERLHGIERLCRRYGATVEDVLAERERIARALDHIEGADERRSDLLRQRDETCERLRAEAKALSAGREAAARSFARSVERHLRELAMPKARFAVALEPAPPPEGLPCGPTGAEAAEFLFSANPGEPPKPLRQVASGGELSRFLLAAKTAARRSDSGMVLVFDEVDAGIGGRAADRVGRNLARLAARNQVLCITHLPQIAAFADVHFRVERDERGGRTRARIVTVEGTARVEEIARMAGGQTVTEATRRHARELLETKAQARGHLPQGAGLRPGRGLPM